jgi:hypothetical protein
LVHQWQVKVVVSGGAHGGRNSQRLPVPERNSNIGKLERLSDGLDDSRQHRFRGERRLQSPAEARYDGVRIVTITIDEVVDSPLYATAKRVEKKRDNASGDEGWD